MSESKPPCPVADDVADNARMAAARAARLPDVLAAVTLGPEDRLVLAFPAGVLTNERAKRMAEAARSAGLGSRVLFVGGADPIALRATKAEGSTVGQCGDKTTLWLPGKNALHAVSALCHLAYGHTGMHSDGEATWSNEGSDHD